MSESFGANSNVPREGGGGSKTASPASCSYKGTTGRGSRFATPSALPLIVNSVKLGSSLKCLTSILLHLEFSGLLWLLYNLSGFCY